MPPKKYNIQPDDPRKEAGYGLAGREKVKEMLKLARKSGARTKKSQKDEDAESILATIDDEDEYESEDDEFESETEEEEEEEVVKPRARSDVSKVVRVKVVKEPKPPKEPKEPRLTKKDMAEMLESNFKTQLAEQMASLRKDLRISDAKESHKKVISACLFPPH